MSRTILLSFSLASLVFLTAVKCSRGTEESSEKPQEPGEAFWSVKVVATMDHDSSAFTQGLVFLDGVFYESTGLYGESSLRKVALNSGEVLQKKDLPKEYFAEGLAFYGGSLFQLTWKARKVFKYGLKDGAIGEPTELPLPTGTEGWGLTTDGASLILSDGSDQLYFLDPESLAQEKKISVTSDGVPVKKLNELEWIDGQIWANVWQSNVLLVIDPKTGVVEKEVLIDLDQLFTGDQRRGVDSTSNVLNGIAWDEKTKRLWITGKNWPLLFQVELEEKQP